MRQEPEDYTKHESTVSVRKKHRQTPGLIFEIVAAVWAVILIVRNTLFRKQKHMDPTLIISGFSAALQAVQTWLQFRDRKRAAVAFKSRYTEAQTEPKIQQQAATLRTLVPQNILDVMGKRVQNCWDNYETVLENDKKYLPGQVDDATDAMIACACRELNRIYKLNKNIPEGPLRDFWEAHCRAAS